MRQFMSLAISFVSMYVVTGAPNLAGKWLGISLTIGGAFMWALIPIGFVPKALNKKINQASNLSWQVAGGWVNRIGMHSD